MLYAYTLHAYNNTHIVSFFTYYKDTKDAEDLNDKRFPVLRRTLFGFWAPRFLHSALVQSRVIQGGEEDRRGNQWKPLGRCKKTKTEFGR